MFYRYAYPTYGSWEGMSSNIAISINDEVRMKMRHDTVVWGVWFNPYNFTKGTTSSWYRYIPSTVMNANSVSESCWYVKRASAETATSTTASLAKPSGSSFLFKKIWRKASSTGSDLFPTNNANATLTGMTAWNSGALLAWTPGFVVSGSNTTVQIPWSDYK